MTDDAGPPDPIGALAALAEPTRRRLYECVVAREGRSVGRDEAAGSLGIGRALAAFHLDRLVEAGLLVAEYRRLSERRGPGAGRPAKLYHRAAGTLDVSVPDRRYATAATIFATALSQSGLDAPVDDARLRARLLDVARTEGRRLGARAATQATGDAGGDGRAVLLAALREGGFGPQEAVGGRVVLGNCPFEAVARMTPDVTCAMNLALLAGMADAIGETGLAPVPVAVALSGGCCAELLPSDEP